MLRVFLFILIFLFTCAPVYAGVVINEIAWMGTKESSYCEWIELHNDGLGTQDLAGWGLYEISSNGDILIISLSKAILAGGYYLIERVTNSCPDPLPGIDDVSGSFGGSGLNNSGEMLILKDAQGNDIDSIDGSGGWPGGDSASKETMQKTLSGWATGEATPGAENIFMEENTAGGDAPVDSQLVGSSGIVIMAESVSKIKAMAGEDRVVLAGAEVFFEGASDGFTEDIVNKAYFYWNFGDGKTADGKSVAHSYSYPGSYSVFLTVSFAGMSDSDISKILVIENPVVLSEVKPSSSEALVKDGFIEIYNFSARKIDFSGFGISIGNQNVFYFSAGSFLQPYAYLALSADSLNFRIPGGGNVKIIYPNGKDMISSVYPYIPIVDDESLNLIDGVWQKSTLTPGEKNSVPKKISLKPKTSFQAGASESIKKIEENGNQSVKSIESGGQMATTVFPDYGDISFFNEEYRWLITGLGVGVLIGAFFLLAKRYFS